MLAQSTPAIIWYQPQQATRNAVLLAREEELKVAGFEVHIHTHPQSFYPAAAKALASPRALAPLVFMISGINSESLAAISRLRMQSVYIPIMVEFPVFIEEQALQALYSGADDCCILDTVAALWVAKIECLLRRSRHYELKVLSPMGPEAPKPPVPELQLRWFLTDEGWLLKSPEGLQIALTTTERQFLLTLCSKPDRGASHQELLSAIDGSSSDLNASSGPNRLGVLISRLKRKAFLAGLRLPIRSIYKWGYVFSAPIQIG